MPSVTVSNAGVNAGVVFQLPKKGGGIGSGENIGSQCGGPGIADLILCAGPQMGVSVGGGIKGVFSKIDSSLKLVTIKTKRK